MDYYLYYRILAASMRIHLVLIYLKLGHLGGPMTVSPP